MQIFPLWIVSIFSYSIILFILLSFPSIFFKYIFIEKNRLFSIADNNVRIAQYLNIIVFFTYQIFIVFFYRIFSFKIIPVTTRNVQKKVLHFFINRVFIHIITFFFNQYDFSLFTWNNRYNFGVESVDFTSSISLYQGFYWDFFFICFYLQQLIFIIFQKPFYFSKRIYVNSGMHIKFWPIFYKNVVYRFFTYLMVFYFFGGEGLYKDSILRVSTIFFVERTYITFSRYFYLLIIK